MTEKVNIISAELDPRFYQLDVDRIVVEIPKQQIITTTKGTWVSIKYRFVDGQQPLSLNIQTSELFSNGLYKHNEEEKCPIKFSLIMTNRSSKQESFSKEQSETEKENSKVEEKTIQIFEEITEKIKKEMLKSEMVNALQKSKDKTWKNKVETMEILKTQEKENNEYQTFFLNAKLSNISWFQTKFFKLNEKNELTYLNFEETKNNFLQNKTKCHAVALVTIDSIFVGKEPYIQTKLKQAIFTKMKNFSNTEPEGIVPSRIANKTIVESSESDDTSEDET
jgi:hypothetical protein